jgi:glycosyltransferase involved in cell wall biosynthesis
MVVTGKVPDIRPYLRRATAAVVPLVYGAGVQFKVLEAMACATPVVTTPQAAAPLAAVPGRDVLTAEDADDFAGIILKLLSDQEMQRRVGAYGRAYVETHHNWTTITTRLAEIYREAGPKLPV